MTTAAAAPAAGFCPWCDEEHSIDLLEAESGVSLRVAGWEPRALTTGGRWDTPARRRDTEAPTGRKRRWERDLF